MAALSYVRDFISGEATNRNVSLTMNAEVNWEATALLLQRIHPQLVELIRRRQQSTLSLAIEEAATDQLALDATADWMTAEFRDIIQAGKESHPSNNRYTVEEYQSKANTDFILLFFPRVGALSKSFIPFRFSA